MQSLQQFLMYGLGGLVFLLVITVLVAVHELGHLWVARACGMKVDAFAIMMGGRRTTDLAPLLTKPLTPSRNVWLTAALGVMMLAVGAASPLAGAYPLGLTLLGIVVPIWIASRIAALYHLEAAQVVKPIAICWLVGCAILMPAARSGSLQLTQVLFVLGYASLVALIVLYYQPVLRKGEDTPMGEGNLQIDGRDTPVQFRPLLSRKAASGTEYSLLLIPLGGFAAISGMAPKNDGSETQLEGGFYSKPPLSRLATLFAGPLFSMLFGVLMLVALFTTVGRATPDMSPVIGTVLDKSVAQKAGLKVGDTIVRVNDEEIKTFYDVVRIISSRPLKATRFEFERDGKPMSVTVTPEVTIDKTPVIKPDLSLSMDEKRRQGKMGIGWRIKMERLPLGRALTEAFAAPVEMVQGLVSIAREPSTAKQEVGGPGTIAVAAVEATSQGLSTVLLLAGVLSISFGVMNLLPIPPMLDGGQMVVAFVELLRGGKRLSMQVQQLIASGGMILVLMLIVGVMAIDVNRFVGPKEKLTTDKPLPQSQGR